ncbi:esterase/lipase family protein [Candidatus Nitrotoga sp. AM1P]|uniref:esterase/lipase family protein n=1 Tax=Candidatus Nitrotoga sp. AM1P TaxID=2559597 RepID=UPI0010B9F938|nr:hypothetical protein [Candidatus Nitrotoga sp. AM1P]BBJ22267.1 hypothetical protein W01_01940 [Candidatus Nitrotoga sp. AM1P]
MPVIKAPYFPIIYVRGYAMTHDEINQTTADPFCGFNLGSTVYRAVPNKNQKPRKYVFESPVVRLGSDFGYSDVYEDGYDIVDPEWEVAADGTPTDHLLTGRSIVIYRYYDPASTLLGDGHTPSIEAFAEGLGILVAKVRKLVCKNPANKMDEKDFRCYLVAHSMGGLVCRAFLQNPALDPGNMRAHVDKLFTYATPHNGIDLLGINTPSWLTAFDIDNFNRKGRMTEYLNLKQAFAKHDRVDLMPEDRFSSRKVFCMVGTNRMDYDTAAGLSRTFVGNGSDGLVRIANATLMGLNTDGSIGEPCAKAFAFRSHSGYFGIVNSEEAFQNLTRFLFGDVRVDLWLDIEDIRLPIAVQAEADAGRSVNALYQIEVLTSPRGKLWYLSRRTAEEDSVACVPHASWKEEKAQYLSSVFLANRAKVNRKRRSLAYSLTIGIRAPDYEIENRLWINEHYEGSYLFRNALILEMVPPRNENETWKVKYSWQGAGMLAAETVLDVKPLDKERVEVAIPFDSYTMDTKDRYKLAFPGLKGSLRFVISAWNAELEMDD